MELAFPTPRSWEMVSNVLNNVSENIETIYPMISGCVGTMTASQFRSWVELHDGLPKIEKIFSEGKGFTPKEKELQIALKSMMVRYARQHPNKNLIDNSIDYACGMPWSFRGKLMQDYYQIPELKDLVVENEVFQTAVKDGLKC